MVGASLLLMNGTALFDPSLRLLWCDYKLLPAGVWRHHEAAHPFWRLYWNHEAGATVRCGRGIYEPTPESLLLIAPHTVVSTANGVDLRHFYVHFQLLSGGVDPGTRIALLPLTGALRELKERVIALLEGGNPVRLSLAVRALVLAVLSEGELDVAAKGGRDPRMAKVLNEIEANLAGELSSALLAQRTAMSVSGFNRQFRREMGCSLQEYLKGRRVARACRLLRESEASIEEVAEAVGFCDRYHFSRVFKQHQGMGPGAFRQLHRDLRPL